MDKTSDNNIDSMDNGKMAEDRAGQQTANDGKADKSSKTDKDTASKNPFLDSDKTNKAGKSGNKNRKEQKKVNVEKTDDNEDDGKLLTVTFNNGREYVYEGVPVNIYEDFSKAESKGKYFHENINYRYNYSRIK